MKIETPALKLTWKVTGGDNQEFGRLTVIDKSTGIEYVTEGVLLRHQQRMLELAEEKLKGYRIRAYRPTMTDTEWYNCRSCHQDFRIDEAQSECVFAATQEEPAEYLDHCPHCNSTFLRLETKIWCRTCGDVQVRNVEDQCGECYTCEQEAKSDAALDR